jgi:hypothetical protein
MASGASNRDGHGIWRGHQRTIAKSLCNSFNRNGCRLPRCDQNASLDFALRCGVKNGAWRLRRINTVLASRDELRRSGASRDDRKNVCGERQLAATNATR